MELKTLPRYGKRQLMCNDSFQGKRNRNCSTVSNEVALPILITSLG